VFAREDVSAVPSLVVAMPEDVAGVALTVAVFALAVGAAKTSERTYDLAAVRTLYQDVAWPSALPANDDRDRLPSL